MDEWLPEIQMNQCGRHDVHLIDEQLETVMKFKIIAVHHHPKINCVDHTFNFASIEESQQLMFYSKEKLIEQVRKRVYEDKEDEIHGKW